MKRVLSFLLAALLVLTCLPLAVFAAEGDEWAFSSDFATDKNITYDAEAATITYGGNWQFALLDPSKNGAFVAVPRTNHHSVREDERNWAITQIAYDGIQTNGWSCWYWGSHPGSGGMYVDDYTIAFTNGQVIPSYTYTVTEKGDFNFYPYISSFTASGGNVAYHFAIFVNEKMVWPVYGGKITLDSPYTPFVDQNETWYVIDSTTTLASLNEALSTVVFSASEGDRIEFAFRFKDADGADAASKYMTQRQDGNRIMMTPAFHAKAHSDTETAPRYVIINQDNVTVSSTQVTTPTVTAPAYTGQYIFLGWDVNGDGKVDYVEGDEVALVGNSTVLTAVTIGLDRFTDNMPAITNGDVEFRGNWTIGRYGVNTDEYDLYVTPDSPGNILSVTGSPWGGTGGGLYIAGDIEKFALSGALEGGEYVGQIQYTAPYNGTVTIDFTKLNVKRELNGNYVDDTTAGGYVESYVEYDFAICKNGKKVWPTATDWWEYKSAEPDSSQGKVVNIIDLYYAALETDPLSIDVQVGDTLEFRVRQGNEYCWMVFMMPVVKYTTVSDTPMVTASSVTVEKDVSLNMFVSLNQQITREGAKAGLLCWTTEQTTYDPTTGTVLKAVETVGDKTRFTYKLSAKQMADDIYVMPYSYIEGEADSTIYGPVSVCSVVRYAEVALGMDAGLDAQIVALLNYGADAQNLFNYNRYFLANSILTADQKEAGELNCKSVYAQSTDGTNGANIKNVSLLLNDRVGMKLMIDAIDGVTNYTLQVSRTADFAEYEEIAMVATESGSEYKGIFEVDNSDINTTFYFRVTTDGTTYGNVLTYSVDTYVARMNEGASDSLYYAIYWMSVLGDLAAPGEAA